MDDDDVWTMDQKGGGTRVQTGGFDVVMEVLIPTTSHVPERERGRVCKIARTKKRVIASKDGDSPVRARILQSCI